MKVTVDGHFICFDCWVVISNHNVVTDCTCQRQIIFPSAVPYQQLIIFAMVYNAWWYEKYEIQSFLEVYVLNLLGGKFLIDIEIPESYPFNPPKVITFVIQ